MRRPIKLWIEALRSGKYKQGKGYLKRGNKYCCLGVAIDLYNKCHKTKVSFPRRKADLARTHETEEVRNWLKLAEGSGDYDEDNLANLNDEGKSFKFIAKIIEDEPKGLFTS